MNTAAILIECHCFSCWLQFAFDESSYLERLVANFACAMERDGRPILSSSGLVLKPPIGGERVFAGHVLPTHALANVWAKFCCSAWQTGPANWPLVLFT